MKKGMYSIVFWIVLSLLFLIVIIVGMSQQQDASKGFIDVIRGLIRI